MFDKIFAKENVDEALANLLSKKDGISTDGLKIENLAEYYDVNSENLIKEIKTGLYEPYDVIGRYMLQKNGKHRFITSFASTDRLIMRLIYQAISPMIEIKLKDCSYAYRKNKGVLDAINACLNYINNGYKYIIKIDVKDFFDEIDHNTLKEKLGEYIDNENLIKLLEKYMKLNVKIIGENRNFKIKKGIAQGSSLSPLFSNIYLDIFDEFCLEKNWNIVRYGDDINIFLSDNKTCASIVTEVENFLMDNLKLSINQEKLKISIVDDIEILGYSFKLRNGLYFAHKKDRKEHTVYYDWHRIEYKKLFGEYHIISDGILRKKDFTLFFENNEKFQHIPVNSVNSISVYSDTYFTSEFFREISYKKIPLYLYDKNRKFLGAFTSPDMEAGGNVLLAQCAAYLDGDRRLSIAKAIVIASAKNIKANLIYYRKGMDGSIYRMKIDKISKTIEYIDKVDNISTLMIKEANIRNIYFSVFDEIIKSDEFSFKKRSMRPPKNAVNSMISFGNTLLYNYFYTSIIKNKLDIRISYLHSSSKRRHNLNLDLSEMFKPLIVDRLIFKLINKRMINIDLHFEERDNGVFLNAEGRKVFLEHFTNLMIHYHSTNDGGLNYVRIIDEEIKKFKRVIMNNEEYLAYVSRI